MGRGPKLLGARLLRLMALTFTMCPQTNNKRYLRWWVVRLKWVLEAQLALVCRVEWRCILNIEQSNESRGFKVLQSWELAILKHWKRKKHEGGGVWIKLKNCCSDPREWVEEMIHLGVTEYTSFLNTGFQQRSTLCGRVTSGHPLAMPWVRLFYCLAPASPAFLQATLPAFLQATLPIIGNAPQVLKRKEASPVLPPWEPGKDSEWISL